MFGTPPPKKNPTECAITILQLKHLFPHITVFYYNFSLYYPSNFSTLHFTHSFFSDPVSGKKLTSTLLMFITGSQILTDELKIEFNNDPTKSLLEADSCFNKVILPICHNSYTKFKQACQTSLAWSSQGYGRF